jgi:hypothetical protein
MQSLRGLPVQMKEIAGEKNASGADNTFLELVLV